ncbi:MAG: molybdopterin-dependent oxidoreductase, partial [Actinomycetales bacterium]
MVRVPDHSRLWAAGAGVVSAAAGVAAGELAAAAVSPSVSPLTAAGGAVIDALPPGVKSWAVAAFGTSDKFAFIISMCLVMAVIAAAVGVAEFRRRLTGVAILAVFGILGIAAVATRADATTGAYAGPVVAAVVAGAVLALLRRRFITWAAAAVAETGAGTAEDAGLMEDTGAVEDAGVIADRTTTAPLSFAGTAPQGRRSFLRAFAVSAAVAAVAAVIAGAAHGTSAAIASARAKLKLPTPSSPAPPIPTSARLNVPGISDLVTANTDFYRIDTALVVPSVNPDSWKLTVTGMVDREVELDLATLLGKPLIERYVTIACVSNEVGGNLIGNAKWLGWPVRELLAEAGVKPGADMVFSSSTDGFTASTPLAAMTDSRDAMIAVGMNGELLPLEHGFPARLIVPGLYGFVSATKWLKNLNVTRFGDEVAYWSSRGWSDHGPIKLSSRIDTPRDGRSVTAGKVQFGGMAWA